MANQNLEGVEIGLGKLYNTILYYTYYTYNTYTIPEGLYLSYFSSRDPK